MKFFHSVRRGVVGDGTVRELMQWLESYIALVVPNNGIEYWANHTSGGEYALKVFQSLPVAGLGMNDLIHPVCYVRSGNESPIIELGLQLRNGMIKSLGWVKSFGSDEECWRIAHALTQALESILLQEDVPLIVEMSASLPRKWAWETKSSLQGQAKLVFTPFSLSLVDQGGAEIFKQDWSDLDAAHAWSKVEACRKDWVKVLLGCRVDFAVQMPEVTALAA